MRASILKNVDILGVNCYQHVFVKHFRHFLGSKLSVPLSVARSSFHVGGGLLLSTLAVTRASRLEDFDLSNMEITARDLFFYLFTILLCGLPIVIYFGEKRVGKLTVNDWIPIPPATEIVSLRIYPIKSCRGIEVSQSKLLRTGLDLDRQWMFVSAAKHRFQTIREISKLTLVNTAINEKTDELEISLAHDESKTPAKVIIPAHPTQEWLKENTKLVDTAIWGETWDAYEYHESISQPFAEFLGKDIRLVMRGPTPRVLIGNGAPTVLGRTEATKFADLGPVLVANVRSINELNQRLMKIGEDAITLERFRPNIVVVGSDAWSEDVWKTIKISPRAVEKGGEETEKGEKECVVMDVIAQCPRCHVPNVDPDTGKRHLKQPWNTLMSYRNIDAGIPQKPFFGDLCAPRSEGMIKVGDNFEITEVTAEHKFIKEM